MKLMTVYDSVNAEGEHTRKTMVWPDSALVRTGKPVFIPEGNYYIHAGIGARIDAVGKTVAPKFAGRYYKEIFPAIFLLPEEASKTLAEGRDPKACDIVADYSVIVGDDFGEETAAKPQFTATDLKDPEAENVLLEWPLSADTLNEDIAEASIKNTLKTGDIVATIHKAGVPAKRDTLLRICINDRKVLENKLK